MGVVPFGRPAGTAMALLLSRDCARGGAVAVARAQVMAPSGTPPAGGGIRGHVRLVSGPRLVSADIRLARYRCYGDHQAR